VRTTVELLRIILVKANCASVCYCLLSRRVFELKAMKGGPCISRKLMKSFSSRRNSNDHRQQPILSAMAPPAQVTRLLAALPIWCNVVNYQRVIHDDEKGKSVKMPGTPAVTSE
jgi:hypothetical protein